MWGHLLVFSPLNEAKNLDDMHVLNGIFLKNSKRGKSIQLKIDDNKTWILCYLNWSQQCRLNMEENKIVFIGAGNLATNLAKAFYDQHIKISQIYSRTEDSARSLAEAVEADYTTILESVINDADI